MRPRCYLPGRRALRSAGSNRLVVPLVNLFTVGSRAFPVAAAKLWNSKPDDIVLADSLWTFWRQLKHYKAVLPKDCTVTVTQLCHCDTLGGPSGGNSYFGHYKTY